MGGRLAGIDALDLMLQAGWLVQLVLLILLGFSIVSWALIYTKWRELRSAGEDSEAFLEVYHDGSLDAAYDAGRSCDASPLANVFLAGYAEIHRMAKLAGKRAGRDLSERQLQTLSQHVRWAASREALRLERGLSFLATTGSAAPFIGLFGTVVGIINAFTGIGIAGSASLAVVAPGIAEALIATAVGLFAAIPATVFYNVFVAKLRELNEAIDLYSAELEGDLRRHGASTETPAQATGG
jgi:biopolymer transport protein TolQ